MWKVLIDWSSSAVGAGIISTVVGGLIVAALLAFVRPLRRGAVAVGKGIAWFFTHVRVTTEPRRPREQPMLMPVRWDVGRLKGKPAETYTLGNFGDGEAFDVRLDASGPDVALRSSAAWPRVEGQQSVDFRMSTGGLSFFIGVHFLVRWKDANGVLHRQDIQKRSN